MAADHLRGWSQRLVRNTQCDRRWRKRRYERYESAFTSSELGYLCHDAKPMRTYPQFMMRGNLAQTTKPSCICLTLPNNKPWLLVYSEQYLAKLHEVADKTVKIITPRSHFLMLTMTSDTADFKHLNHLSDDMDFAWDKPPPYELHSSSTLLSSSYTVQGIAFYLLLRS